MKLSRFFGATNREALRQVRLALGPDALIVSNRRINGGVEILASDPTALPIQNTPGDDVMGAIGEMRGALEMRIDGLLWANQLRRSPQGVSLYQTLLTLGFSTALLRAMIKRLPLDLSSGAAIQWARDELVKHLPVTETEDDLWAPGATVALVGPTGTGKTTTLAKLAVRCVKRHGSENLVLLTTDTYRVGAYEQLKIIGQMMGVAVHVVQDAKEFTRIMRAIRPEQTILVDNAGFSQRDPRIHEQAAMLAADAGGRQMQRILVLNASSHGDTLDEVARTYRDDGGSRLSACIITKIDEATRMSAALDTAIRYQLPISYVSNGQRVPQDLHFCEAGELVDQAFQHYRQNVPLYAPTQADFAALMSLTGETGPDSADSAGRAWHKDLLPGLLAAMGDSGTTFTWPELKEACDYLDDHCSCSQAYELWRSFRTRAPDPAALRDTIARLLDATQSALDKAQPRQVLAVHDRIALKTAASGCGDLHAAVLLTGQGEALATPVQHLAFGDGWQSSCGSSAPAFPAPADVLLRQIQWLHEQRPQWPLIHLFRGGTQALWRKLSDLGAVWLTQCAGATKIETESGLTTISALARTLEYRPVADLEHILLLSDVCGRAASSVALWATSVTVNLPSYQGTPLRLQLLSVRVVLRRDGAVLKTITALTNLADIDTNASSWAPWLVVQAEARTGFRYAAQHWRLLEQHQSGALQIRALTAMQLGLAAWHVAQTPEAAPVRTVNRSLAGQSALTAPAVAASMLKLFALKELAL